MILPKLDVISLIKSFFLSNRVSGQILAEDAVSAITGEVVAEKGTKITREIADMIQNAAVPYIWVEGEETSRNIKVLSNMMVDLQAVVDIDPAEVGVTEQVYYPVLAGIIEESAGDVDEMKRLIKRDLHDLIPKHITKEDILHLSTTTCILSMAWEMMMISTIWVTDVSVRLENFFRTSTESVCPDWKELFVRE